jgi:hypothetical protein
MLSFSRYLNREMDTNMLKSFLMNRNIPSRLLLTRNDIIMNTVKYYFCPEYTILEYFEKINNEVLFEEEEYINTFINSVPIDIKPITIIVVKLSDANIIKNPTECCICYEEVNNLNEIKLNCNHELCKECYKKIVKSNNCKCPLCREDIKEVTVNNVDIANDLLQNK